MGKPWKAMQQMFQRGKWKILRGDSVMIMAGKDKGEIGVVKKVTRDTRRPTVVVEGRNLVRKHVKKTKDSSGGVITMESPLHYSNVQLLDPVNGAPVRCQWRYLEDGTKVRISIGKRASKSIIPKPEILKKRLSKKLATAGLKNTSVAEVETVTYSPATPLPALGFAASAVPSKPSTASAVPNLPSTQEF